jgi:actin-like ATPase involved in cell morphogenesis
LKRIGIDFGTSTTLIAYRENEASAPVIIPIGTGAFPWIPSVVSRNPPIDVVENFESLESDIVLESPKSGLTDSDRFLERNPGVSADEIRKAVEAIIREVVTRAKNQIPNLFSDSKVFMGCPALWSGENRRIIADTANSLGIDVDVMSVIDEPVAAGIQWIKNQWIDKGTRLTGRVLVFDAGGGTLDVALLDIQGEDSPSITVLSADSLAKSGDELDLSIVRHLVSLDPTLGSSVSAYGLKRVAKRLKESLSEDDEASQVIDTNPPKLLRLTQSELEEIAKQQLDESMTLVKRVLKMGKLRFMPIDTIKIRKWPIHELANEVDFVVLVGGLSRLKSFKKRLQEIFNRADFYQVENPQQTVAEGLTYGDVMKSLNMPRPPINFYVSSQNLSKPVPVYEAFSRVFSVNDALIGKSYLSHKVFLNEFGNGEYSFYCEWPDRKRTRIRFKVDGQEVDTLLFEQDLRSVSGGVSFFLYATGEICVRGSGKVLEVRITEWPALHGSNDLSQVRLELEKKKYENSYDTTDKSASSRK